jgi:hypothetical protein
MNEINKYVMEERMKERKREEEWMKKNKRIKERCS